MAFSGTFQKGRWYISHIYLNIVFTVAFSIAFEGSACDNLNRRHV